MELWKIKISIKDSIANALYHLGFKPSSSTGICGRLTKGYGKLDDNGYWEYDIHPKFFKN